MAWSCSGSSNEEMVLKLKENNIIKNDKVESAMLAVDRAKYCHVSGVPYDEPYQDCPKSIGFNATISAPHMHAYALSYLTEQLFDGAKALDVGSGSGYLTACMAHMVGPKGCVIGIEHIPELIEISKKNLQADNPQLLKEARLQFLAGDGRQGVAVHGPFNAIHVGAAAAALPQELVNQLAPGGRLICPVMLIEGSTRFQSLMQVDKKSDGTIEKKNLMYVSYVPLTDANNQLRI